MTTQRDAFISAVTRAIASHPEVLFLSADFGAPALDDLRARYPDHFLHCGISEQAMIDMATGLALEGHTVVAYAMAPFLSLRALEQIKCGPGLMMLPIVLVSVGVGLGYADAGPTHYATEDLACLRAIVGSSVYTASDAATADAVATHVIQAPAFSYVRLDRHASADLEPAIDTSTIARGWRQIGTAAPGRLALVSHGRMVHACVDLATMSPDRCVVIDVIRSKPFPEGLVSTLASANAIIVVDEQTPAGSLPSAVFEACAAAGVWPRIVPLTLPEAYVFDNGGREALLAARRLSVDGIRQAAASVGVTL